MMSGIDFTILACLVNIAYLGVICAGKITPISLSTVVIFPRPLYGP